LNAIDLCNIQHTLPDIPVVQINLAAKSLIGVLIWPFVDLEKEHTRVASKNTEIETRVFDFDSSNRNSQQQQQKNDWRLDLDLRHAETQRVVKSHFGMAFQITGTSLFTTPHVSMKHNLFLLILIN